MIFRGTESEVSEFRNAFLRFVRATRPELYARFFPNSADGHRRHGRCTSLTKFRAACAGAFKLEDCGGRVRMVDVGDRQCASVHPPADDRRPCRCG